MIRYHCGIVFIAFFKLAYERLVIVAWILTILKGARLVAGRNLESLQFLGEGGLCTYYFVGV